MVIALDIVTQGVALIWMAIGLWFILPIARITAELRNPTSEGRYLIFLI